MSTRRPRLPHTPRPASGARPAGGPGRPSAGLPSGQGAGGLRSARDAQAAGGSGPGTTPGVRRVGADTAGSRPAEAEPVPARSFSGRLLALTVILAAITVMLAPSVRIYLQQQGELNALRGEIAQQEDQRRDLQRQIQRWEDPAYIRQQARERIFLVMPGERRYLVRGGIEDEDLPEQAAAAVPEDLPWADALWESVTRAAQP